MSYERVNPGVMKTMHWKFLSCKELGSGMQEPTATTMKDEKMPEIGPPMGETGSCISYNYLGSSKLDPLTVYVRCWDPHWSMRKISTSLGKVLREHFRKTPLWYSSHSLVFCSFKKTVAALKGPFDGSRGFYTKDEYGSQKNWTVCDHPLFRDLLKGIFHNDTHCF